VAAYRAEADIIGVFLSEYTIGEENGRLPTALLYSHYTAWAKDNGYHAMNSRNFVGEHRKRHEIRRDGATGRVIIGLALSFSADPCPGEKLPWD
jgi:phage/plasmid-associated DNA primase